ncbi:ABC transporter related protein [Caldicellulosiruptor hydrothermalis 108]|uniref:ABC transporter related protein n=1 Tax=Caldicellulosiruptor hydrothermalis (strain DSM 18901 / VKM B-2411 / 108) TaxID=632292 RepID=E4QDV0_CALH1|nr:ABC transporter ATP-binding protein [Caldicellulosiruptor hydrothermalis]ADQ07641.1 ABC transporter related protein [Caldicellulosiruptor hydrothermalis 108]
MSFPIYIAAELTKKFGNKMVIDKLSFEIYENEFVYLKGANGAGKTTLLNIIAKLDNLWSGELKFKGVSLKKIKLHNYPISYIPDTPIFYEGLTVKEHLNFISSMYGLKDEEAREIVDIYVSVFNLKEYLNYLPSQLSRGNKQKVMLCCGLLKDFEVLIADEPFNFLDSDSIKALFEILSIIKSSGKTIILTSHEVEYIKSLIDREIELKRSVE